jgi:hypothetical protein
MTHNSFIHSLFFYVDLTSAHTISDQRIVEKETSQEDTKNGMTKGTDGAAETDSEYEHGADSSNNKYLHRSFEGNFFVCL